MSGLFGPPCALTTGAVHAHNRRTTKETWEKYTHRHTRESERQTDSTFVVVAALMCLCFLMSLYRDAFCDENTPPHDRSHFFCFLCTIFVFVFFGLVMCVCPADHTCTAFLCSARMGSGAVFACAKGYFWAYKTKTLWCAMLPPVRVCVCVGIVVLLQVFARLCATHALRAFVS